MEYSRARLLEHLLRRCFAMYFIIVIMLNVPLSLFNLIAVYLIFKLGNSPCFEGQRPSLPFLSVEVEMGDVQRNDTNVRNATDITDENPESPDENPENPDFHPENPDFPDFPPHGNREIAPKSRDEVNPNPYPDINPDCLCKCVVDPEHECDCDK